MKQVSLLLLLGSVLFCVPLHAQDSQTAVEPPEKEAQDTKSEYLDTLYLPELTTVISGDSWMVTEEALPQYSLELPESPTEEETVVELVKVELPPDVPPSVVDLATVTEEKQFFVQGFIEPAWPLSLDTKFSVGTAEPASFFLDFGYKAIGGYGLEQAEDGFFHNKSFLQVGKSFTPGNLNLKIQGNYKSLDNGLQGQSLLFDDINRRGACAQIQLELPLGSGFAMGGGLPVDWYNRYAGFSNTVGRTEENGAVAVSMLNLAPWLAFNWKRGSWNEDATTDFPKTHEFSAQLLIDWNYSASLDPEMRASKNSGGFALSGSWLWNSTLEVMANLGLVYVPSGSGQDSTKFLMPFSLGASWNWAHSETLPWHFLGKLPKIETSGIQFAMKGGLDSRHRNFYQLEEKEPFVNFSPKDLITYGEESDWFFGVCSQFPLFPEKAIAPVFLQEMLLDLSLEYRQSAFGNNVLTGNYDVELNGWTGLFPAEIQAQQKLSTEIAVTLAVSNFLFRAGWNSQWLDHPVYEAPQRIFLLGRYDSSVHPWGGILQCELPFKGPDSLPLLQGQVYYKPAENLQLALSLKDILKLLSGRQRVFVEPYMKEAGSVSLSLQFNF